MRAVFLFILITILGSFARAESPEAKVLDPSDFDLRGDTLNSKECQKIYLRLIENFVGWAEQHFEENNTYEEGGGYFNARGRGVDWARGNSNVCLAYAVLLDAHPDRSHFSAYEIPREQLEDHLRRTIRFLCMAYEGDKKPSWGPGWQVSLDFVGAAWAAHLIESELNEHTVDMVRQVSASVADSLDKEIPSRRFGDTGSEDCAWNTAFLAFAANKYSADARAEKWDMLSKKWALNTLSTPADSESTKTIDGRPLSEWIVSNNVHPDLTIENHGMWSVGYQVQCQFFAESELAYVVFGHEPPQSFAYHADEMWNNVTRALFLWDGDIIFPTGQDWAWKSYSSSEYLCWQRLFRRNAVAAAFESRAIQMALKRQLAVGTGYLGYFDFGNNSTKAKRWAFSYLSHKYLDSPPAISMTEAYEQTLGTYEFPFVKVGIHRTPEKVVSISWHDKNQPIYIFPNGNDTFTSPPFFFSYKHNAGGVEVSSESNTDERDEKSSAWSKIELLDNQTAFTDDTMRICYTRSREDGFTQFVGIESLPNEATLYCTAFRSETDGTFLIQKPFHYAADSIQGFPMHLEQHRGQNWLNLTGHMGYVSTERLPDELPQNEFYAADSRTLTAKVGEWFGTLAVVVYPGQDHEETEKAAAKLALEQKGNGTVTVSFVTSAGEDSTMFKLP